MNNFPECPCNTCERDESCGELCCDKQKKKCTWETCKYYKLEDNEANGQDNR